MEIHSSKILWRWYDVYGPVFLEEPGTKNKRGTRITQWLRVEHQHWVSNGNNDFIQLITDAQTGLVLAGEAGWHTGLCGSRRGDWCPGHSQVCLKSSCRSLEQVVRTCASGGSSEFRYEEESRGKGNICSPAADHGALCRCDHLNVSGVCSGDISLTCFTYDLHNITCMWNRTRNRPENDYTLFHKQSLRFMIYH